MNKIIVIEPEQGKIHVVETNDPIYRAYDPYIGFNKMECAPIDIHNQGITLLEKRGGLLNGEPLNENLYPFIMAGTVVVVGYTTCELVKGYTDVFYESLTDEQVKYTKEWLQALKEERELYADSAH